ncbi:MAG: energy-coupling factor transporter ATPase [Clostridia bacterium]|nr:energy-coupling factor transporter ATPase [Clostridia bacterium]
MPIVIEDLVHVYRRPGAAPVKALEGVSLVVEDGTYLAVLGVTGSGKSTLAQHLNGLLRPTSGRVEVNGVDTAARRADVRVLRQQVGLVFQFPEQQLFETTVWDDVAFAPRHLGLPPAEVRRRVETALEAVGLPEALWRRPPFELSGGQMRRAALAGVLAMEPSILVLDEPTAGLDASGREAVLTAVERWWRRSGGTVVLVTHDLDEAVRRAERLVVLRDGRVVLDAPTRAALSDPARLADCGLVPPRAVAVVDRLRRAGWPVEGWPVTVEEAADAIARAWRMRRRA